MPILFNIVLCVENKYTLSNIKISNLAMGDVTRFSETKSSVSTGVSCDDGEVAVMMLNVAIPCN